MPETEESASPRRHLPACVEKRPRFAQERLRILSGERPEAGADLDPLAGKIWRIGIIGYSCRPDNVMLCLSAQDSVLSDMGMPMHVGDAEAAAHGAYAQLHAKAAAQKQKSRAAA